MSLTAKLLLAAQPYRKDARLELDFKRTVEKLKNGHDCPYYTMLLPLVRKFVAPGFDTKVPEDYFCNTADDLIHNFVYNFRRGALPGLRDYGGPLPSKACDLDLHLLCSALQRFTNETIAATVVTNLTSQKNRTLLGEPLIESIRASVANAAEVQAQPDAANEQPAVAAPVSDYAFTLNLLTKTGYYHTQILPLVRKLVAPDFQEKVPEAYFDSVAQEAIRTYLNKKEYRRMAQVYGYTIPAAVINHGVLECLASNTREIVERTLNSAENHMVLSVDVRERIAESLPTTREEGQKVSLLGRLRGRLSGQETPVQR